MKNHMITNIGIAEDIPFNLDYSLCMYNDSRILSLKSENAWPEILKFEFATNSNE